METTVRGGQTFLDKVIEATGSLENALTIAKINNVSITNSIEVGTRLEYTEVSKKGIISLWNEKNLPATQSEEIDTSPSPTDYLLPQIFPIV